MTLREESGNGPPAARESVAAPQQPAAPQEQAGTPGTAEGHASPAAPDPGAWLVPPGGLPRPRASPAEPDPPAGPAPPDRPAHPAGPSSPGGRGGPPGRRRSLAAVVIGGFAVVCLIGLGGFATILLLHGRAHVTRAALPSVFLLRTGECVNSGPGGVSSPTVVACSQSHDAEIFARFGLAGHQWPGAAAIGAQARQGCTARLSGYLNPQLATTVLAESYVFPDQGAWNAGERTVICEIRGTAGKLTGSVRGLG